MKIKYYLTIPIFFAVFVICAQDSVVYNLKQCVDIAIQNNLNVKISEFQMKSSNERLQQARAANLPYLSGYLNQGISHGKSINPFTNAFINQQVLTGQYGLNAGMVLWNGFSTYNSMRQSAFNYQAGKMDWEQAKMDLTINVMLAYLQVLSNEEQLNQSVSQVDVTRSQVERLKILEKNNAVSPSVMYDTKGQFGYDKLNYINAKASLAGSKISLSQLMNVNFPPNVKFEKVTISNELKEYDSSPDNIFSQASKNLPMIRAAEFRRMGAVKGVHSYWGQLFPTVSLNGSIGTNFSDAAATQKLVSLGDGSTDGYVVVNNTQVPVLAPQYSYISDKISFNNQFKNNLNSYVGLSVQFSIFNSFRTKTQINISKINKLQAEVQQKTTVTRLKSSVQQAHIDVTSAFERFKIIEEQVQDYSASFKIALTKFEKGALTAVDFVISKKNNDIANMSLIAAKYDYILKSKVLDYYMGKLAF